MYGHPIYKMTGPRSTAITSEAAALDAQARANMQNLLLKAGHRRQDRHADHAFRGGSDLPRLAHRGGDGNCRVTKLASRIVVVTAIVALRSDIRELVMSEYRAQQALALPASFRNNHHTT